MTYVLRVSRLMNFSGGFQKLDNVCQLKVENERCKMSRNFLDNSHNNKYCSFFYLMNYLKTNTSIKNLLYPLPMRYVVSRFNGKQNVWNIWQYGLQ